MCVWKKKMNAKNTDTEKVDNKRSSFSISYTHTIAIVVVHAAKKGLAMPNERWMFNRKMWTYVFKIRLSFFRRYFATFFSPLYSTRCRSLNGVHFCVRYKVSPRRLKTNGGCANLWHMQWRVRHHQTNGEKVTSLAIIWIQGKKQRRLE